MHLLLMALVAIPTSAVVVGVSVLPIWRWDTPWARFGSALLLFFGVALFSGMTGVHMCNEGGTPPFVMFAGGALASAVPFLFSGRRWRIAICAWMVCATTMLIAAHLTDIYHESEYTGNPAYSAGRFWHTPITGLYPRSQKR